MQNATFALKTLALRNAKESTDNLGFGPSTHVRFKAREMRNEKISQIGEVVGPVPKANLSVSL